jgi:hypothetical protein
MPGNEGRTYSGTRVLLELEGEIAASLTDAEGGETYADIVSEPPSGGRVKKHLGQVRSAPIRIGFAAGMGKPLFEWLRASLAGKHVTHDGALIFLDYKSTATSRLEFKAARIAEILLPAYGALSKEPTRWDVILQPETASVSHAPLGTLYPVPAAKSAKAWLGSNFSLSLSGLEAACTRVSAVESLRIRFTPEADAPPDVGNLLITVSNVDVQAFAAWHDDFVVAGNNGEKFERSGSIVQRSADLKDTLCSIGLENVGIVRISPERTEGAKDVVARSRIELYLEAITLQSAVLASFAPVKPAGETAPSETVEPAGPRGAELAARLRSTQDAFRTVDDRPPRMREGVAAGEAWARSVASLEELESMVALSDEWTGLRLPDDHSLVRRLEAKGQLVAEPGIVELTRDDYIEGLVAGAGAVYREAIPYLAAGDSAAGQQAEAQFAAAGSAASNIQKQRDDAANVLIDRLR